MVDVCTHHVPVHRRCSIEAVRSGGNSSPIHLSRIFCRPAIWLAPILVQRRLLDFTLFSEDGDPEKLAELAWVGAKSLLTSQ